LGAPSTLVVEKGGIVKVGQLLAKADAFICANVHSSVSGKILKMTLYRFMQIVISD
jgi:electron transport complex protein RnfC